MGLHCGRSRYRKKVPRRTLDCLSFFVFFLCNFEKLTTIYRTRRTNIVLAAVWFYRIIVFSCFWFVFSISFPFMPCTYKRVFNRRIFVSIGKNAKRTKVVFCDIIGIRLPQDFFVCIRTRVPTQQSYAVVRRGIGGLTGIDLLLVPQTHCFWVSALACGIIVHEEGTNKW